MTEKLQAILEAEQLSHLLEIFTAAGITDAILANLSDSHLREIGLDKLGERMRLLLAFEKASKYDVILVDGGGNRVASIAGVLAVVPALGLAGALALVEGAPKPLKEGVTKEEAEEIKKRVEAAGAKVDLKRWSSLLPNC
jgi:ribosomal protein L7/L12